MRWMSRKRNGYKQRIWFGKSSCVEPNCARCTARVTAALQWHMVQSAAHSFADLASAGTVEEAFPVSRSCADQEDDHVTCTLFAFSFLTSLSSFSQTDGRKYLLVFVHCSSSFLY